MRVFVYLRVLKIQGKSMAKQAENGILKSPVKYSQVYNPATGHYIKRELKSGRFLDIKADGKPFRGIALEPGYVKANPSIKKSTAMKAELAVIKVKNDKAA